MSYRIIEVTPVLTTDAYTANDVLFATIEIPLAIPKGKSAILRSIAVIDKDDQALTHDILFLRTAASIGAVNAALNASDAIMGELLTIVQFASGDFYDLINSQFAVQAGNDPGIGVILRPTDKEQQSIWFGGVTRGTPTHSVGGLVYKIGLEID